MAFLIQELLRGVGSGLVAGLVVSIMLWFFKSYLGSYLAEKGKNLATHEDIDKILQQVRQITNETETIKAQISGDLWDRQMRWNLKRDLYFRLLENFGEMIKALAEYLRAAAEPDIADQENRPIREGWERIRNETRKQIDLIAAELRRGISVAPIILNETALQALSEYASATKEAGLRIDIYERIDSWITAVEKAHKRVSDAAKMDLRSNGENAL